MTDSQFKEIETRLETLEENIALLLRAIVVSQKNACEIAQVSPDTPRNRSKAGKLDVLSRDGSRLKFVTLQDAGDLKTRRPK